MSVSGAEHLPLVVGIHASNLEDIANGMEAEGIGLHPTQGHVALLRRMAASMRADAAFGRTPSQCCEDGFRQVHSSDGSAAVPGRSGLPPAINRMLASAKVALPETGSISMRELDTIMTEANIQPADRIAIKRNLQLRGRLTA